MRLRFVLAGASLAFVAAGSSAGSASSKASSDAAHATAVAASAPAQPGKTTRGKLSYYGRRFEGRLTASGEDFDPDALTMAHRSLPFGTRVRVTNRRNGRSVIVRVNDRGPAVASRIGDVSLAAARRLGMLKRGVIDGTLEVLPEEAAAESLSEQ